MPQFNYALSLVAQASRYVIGRGKPCLRKVEIRFRWRENGKRHKYIIDLGRDNVAMPLPQMLTGILATFIYSEDERALLLVLAETPLKGSALAARLGWNKTKCTEILSQLTSRTIIFNGDDGYEISDGPWRELLSPGEIIPRPGQKSAASTGVGTLAT